MAKRGKEVRLHKHHAYGCVFRIRGIHLEPAPNALQKGECAKAELGRQLEERELMVGIVNLCKRRRPALALRVSKPN
jgi:hypothetical protein